MVPGSPSGQQAYRSKVLLHTSPAAESTSVISVLLAHSGPGLLCSTACIACFRRELMPRGGGLTCGGGRGVEVVQALVFVAAPLLLHKIQGVSRGDLQEEETA